MADNHSRDELALLRARVEQLETERRPRPRPRLPRRFLPLALVALLVALVPMSILAANPFNDLTGGVHDANIDLIYNAGITTGCVPNASYCPTANVTREEMASFLARTAGLGANPPVANAKTAQTADLATTATNATNAQTAVTAQNATNATNATNANTVGGYAPNGLVRVALGGTTINLIQNLTGAYTTQNSVTITAPGAGFILVTGAVTVFSNAAACDCETATRVRGTTAGATGTSTQQQAQVGLAANSTRVAVVAITHVVPVTTAGAKTFVLESNNLQPGTGLARTLNPQISALFIPFGSTGAGTLGVEQPAAPDTSDDPTR